MAKKKKKTVASTRKPERDDEAMEPEKIKSKKKAVKLFRKKAAKPVKQEKAKPEIIEKVGEEEALLQSFEEETEKTAELARKKEKRFKLSPEKKQKIRGGILALIGLFALGFIGYFLFGKLFSPQALAELVPADKTIALVEVNVDGAGSQVQLFHEALKSHAVYGPEGMIMLLNTVFPVDYKTEIEPWLGRKAGIVLYSFTAQDGTENETPIMFVESREHNLTLDFLKNRSLKNSGDEVVSTDYNGRKLYEFTMSQPVSFTFLNNYLVVTEGTDVMKSLVDELASGKPKLSEDPSYRKVANNVPGGGLLFAYMDYQRMFDALQKNRLFVAQKGQDVVAFKPFLDLFRSEGLAITAEKDRFVAQTFTALNRDALDGENFLTFSEKYQGELLNLANEDPVVVAGGHDLTKEVNRLEQIFKSGTKTPALIFDGVLEAQKQRYFGKDISLKDDIYPLLKGEYLLTVENSLTEPVVMFFLEMEDPSSDVARLEKLINSFVAVSGVFSPRVQDVTLPDGSAGKEIVATPEKVERTSVRHAGNDIEILKLGETSIALNYVVVNDVAVLSTNLEQLKKVIDRADGRVETGLTTGKYFVKSIQPVLRTADEVMHLKVGAITEAMGLNDSEQLMPYLLPFTNLTMTKNYFDDGISTIYIVDVI